MTLENAVLRITHDRDEVDRIVALLHDAELADQPVHRARAPGVDQP